MACSDEGIKVIEWHRFFSNTNLDVLDVIHGALSVAILYWPDDFLKKRDAIVKILYAKNKKNGDHMSSSPPPSLSFQEALEWYEFFLNNHLDVFDVLHGALSVAVLSRPEDFLKKRDEIASFVNAKKPFQYKNKKIASTSGDTESSDHHTTIISHPVADLMPSPPSSMSFQEPSPPATLHRKDTSKHSRLEANTEETKPKSPTKSDTRKPKKEFSTQKIGHRGRLNKEKQNHHESLVGEILLKHSSKDHHHHHDVQVSGRITTTANKGTPGGGGSVETLVLLSSSAGAKGTSGFKKDNSAAMTKMKLQTIVDLRDEATLERKLEATKRKLYDGYKNAQAAKKRIRLIDATYIIPNQQRSNVPVAVGSR